MSGKRTAATAMAKRIEPWPLDKLVPYEANPRTHSETQIAQIAASIKEFGFTNPILVDTQILQPGNGLFVVFNQGWIQDAAGGYNFTAQDCKVRIVPSPQVCGLRTMNP